RRINWSAAAEAEGAGISAQIWLGRLLGAIVHCGLLAHFWLALRCRVSGSVLDSRDGSCTGDEVEGHTCGRADFCAAAGGGGLHAADAEKRARRGRGGYCRTCRGRARFGRLPVPGRVDTPCADDMGGAGLLRLFYKPV